MVVPPFPVAGERRGSPKFLGASLRACHGLRPRQAPGIQSSECRLCRLPLIIGRRRLLHYCNEAQSLQRRCGPRLRPTQFPVYAYVLSFTLLFLSKRQHLVRVVDYSLPDRDLHPARSTKLRLAHTMPIWPSASNARLTTPAWQNALLARSLPVLHSNPARPVATLRWQRGNGATKYDASAAIWPNTLRRHFGHSYVVNLARNN